MKVRINNILPIDTIKSRIINRMSFLYGMNFPASLIDNMNNAKDFYCENLKETFGALMISRQNEIGIDSSLLDIIGNSPYRIKPSCNKLVEEALGHELLHNTSRSNGYTGIVTATNYRTALNEGITQMFSEDIAGYTVSKYCDGYLHYKKIAKMIKATLGVSPIINSYFYHTKDLETQYDLVSGKTGSYQALNNKMTTIYLLVAKKNEKNNKSLYKNIIEMRVDQMYKDIVMNLVIPKLKRLNEKDKKIYINKIMSAVSDDIEVTNNIKTMLTKYINLDNNELERERQIISKENDAIKINHTIVDMINNSTNGDNLLRSFSVDRKGNITFLMNPPHRITDRVMISKIYLLLSSNYKFPDNVIDEYEKIVLSGKNLVIKTDDILERRKIFTCIKDKLKDRGIILLNSYEECDKEQTIHYTSYIRLKEGEVLSFGDLKKVCQKFGIKKSTEKGNDKYVVHDRLSGMEITASAIRKIALFANSWLYATQSPKKYNERIPGLYSAFSKENEELYDKLSILIKDSLKKGGNLNVSALLNINNPEERNKLSKLFNNPMLYEWAYEYFQTFYKDKNYQAEKEKSYQEMKYKDYTVKKTDIDADLILSH